MQTLSLQDQLGPSRVGRMGWWGGKTSRHRHFDQVRIGDGVIASTGEYSRGCYRTRKMLSFLLGSLKIPNTPVKNPQDSRSMRPQELDFVLFETRSHVAQAVPSISLQLKVALDFRSSRLYYLPRARIIGLQDRTKLCLCNTEDKWRASALPVESHAQVLKTPFTVSMWEAHNMPITPQ